MSDDLELTERRVDPRKMTNAELADALRQEIDRATPLTVRRDYVFYPLMFESLARLFDPVPRFVTPDPALMERVTGADALRDISAGSGAQEIMMERWRQIMHEGFDAEHDDAHDEGELAWAAVCYAAPETVYRQVIDQHNLPRVEFRDPWPWAAVEDKRRPGDITTDERVRELVKAGALIAAEIDRLKRLQASR